jgi:hypothetical protein
MRAALPALAVGSAVGCYRPTIADGGFLCRAGSKPCPDGFLCDPATNTCRRELTSDAGVDRAAADGADGRDGRDGSPDGATDGTTDATDAGCFMPRANCTAQTSCDPFCQTGCACRTKCSVNTGGMLTCNAPVGTMLRTLDQSCDIASPGTAGQADTCAPGLVCLADGCGSRCYQFCRSSSDCANATCSRDAGGGKLVCDVPFAVCNPEAGQTTCPLAAQGCYVSSVQPDRTLCDCPSGAQVAGATCVENRDCLPGLVCVDAFGNGDLRCRPVCTLAASCASCTTARSRAIGGSTTYGFCY